MRGENKWYFLFFIFLIYLLRTFFLILVVFCVVSSFTTFRPNFTSGLLHVIFIWPKRSERRNNTKTTKMRKKVRNKWIKKKINSQIKKPHLKWFQLKDKYDTFCAATFSAIHSSWPNINRRCFSTLVDGGMVLYSNLLRCGPRPNEWAPNETRTHSSRFASLAC